MHGLSGASHKCETSSEISPLWLVRPSNISLPCVTVGISAPNLPPQDLEANSACAWSSPRWKRRLNPSPDFSALLCDPPYFLYKFLPLQQFSNGRNFSSASYNLSLDILFGITFPVRRQSASNQRFQLNVGLDSWESLKADEPVPLGTHMKRLLPHRPCAILSLFMVKQW